MPLIIGLTLWLTARCEVSGGKLARQHSREETASRKEVELAAPPGCSAELDGKAGAGHFQVVWGAAGTVTFRAASPKLAREWVAAINSCPPSAAIPAPGNPGPPPAELAQQAGGGPDGSHERPRDDDEAVTIEISEEDGLVAEQEDLLSRLGGDEADSTDLLLQLQQVRASGGPSTESHRIRLQARPPF